MPPSAFQIGMGTAKPSILLSNDDLCQAASPLILTSCTFQGKCKPHVCVPLTHESLTFLIKKFLIVRDLQTTGQCFAKAKVGP